MGIESLREEHIPAAADLFVKEYKRQRGFLPTLPEAHENPELIIAKIKSMIEKNPGVAAIENGQLTGYMIGYLVNNLKSSQKGVYVPEWGHSAISGNKMEIYQQLYNNISTRWVRNEYFSHSITILAYDKELQNQWYWNGFGMLVVDVIRSCEKRIACDFATQDIFIRRAELTHVKELTALQREHQRYYSRAPIFLAMFEMDDEKFFEEWLQKPQHEIFIAYKESEPVGFIWINPSGDNACYIIRDDKTASITGAFVKPSFRGGGVGKLLLSKAEQWAFENSFKRISLDFESANLLGSRFWLKHFEPVCYSLMRRVDDRLTKAANYIEE